MDAKERLSEVIAMILNALSDNMAGVKSPEEALLSLERELQEAGLI